MPPPDLLSPFLLAVLVPVVLALALTTPPYTLLLLDLVLIVVGNHWEIGGIHVDVTDVLFFGIAVALALRGSGRQAAARLRTPYLALWTILGILACLAYLKAPVNQQWLTDPLRVAYQLYRYCWKPMLSYPLAVMLLGSRWKLQAAFVALLVSADLAAAQAIGEGYAGLRAAGPFGAPNALGGAMIVPAMLCMAGLLSSVTRGQRWFYGISALLVARTLLFSGSRGAFVGTLTGGAFLLCTLLAKGHVRSKVLRLVAAGMILAVVVLAAVPDAFERPNVQRLLSASQGTEAETFQWRLQERWPHFWELVLQHPWFGTGTEVDPSLGEDANTPHNGYLAVALISGIPALAVLLLFAFLGIGDALRVYGRATQRRESVFGVTIAAALIGILVHNIVDATLHQPYGAKVLWLLVAMAAIVVRRPAMLLPQPAASPAAPVERHEKGPHLSVVGGRT